MSTYTQIIYQIVFSTKDRQPTINITGQERLYRFIWGIVKNSNCHLYRINGMEDHIHLVTSIHPSVSLSKLVKDIKLGSSDSLKRKEFSQTSPVGRMDMADSPIQFQQKNI